MARTKSVTTQILNLTGFRSVAGYMNDASDWLSSVGERESVFEEMRSAAAQLDYEGIPALLQNFHVESLSKISAGALGFPATPNLALSILLSANL